MSEVNQETGLLVSGESAMTELIPSTLDAEQQGSYLQSKYTGDELSKVWKTSWGVFCSERDSDEAMAAITGMIAYRNKRIVDIPHDTVLEVETVVITPVHSVDDHGEAKDWIKIALACKDGMIVSTGSDHCRRCLGMLWQHFKGIFPAVLKLKVQKQEVGSGSMASLRWIPEKKVKK